MPSPSANPVFSVVIPTLNRAHLLPRAIDSVLAQTFTDFELLVVADGASSGVAAHCDERIVLIQRGTRGGASAARNTGIRRSKGRYIALLDDDDEFLPRFLEETLRTFARSDPEPGFTWCGIRMVHDTPEGERTVRERCWRLRFDTPAQVRRSRLAASRIGAGFGLTLRRDVFERIGLFDESLLIEDTDLLLRLLAGDVPFAVVPDILVKVHRHPGPKISRRIMEPEYIREHEQLLVRHAGFLASNPRIAANLRDTLCFRYYWRGDRHLAHRLLARGLQERSLTPRALRIFLHFELFDPVLRAFRRAAPPPRTS
jgi:glycosyltransferase involved in cell wall biosynthesis